MTIERTELTETEGENDETSAQEQRERDLTEKAIEERVKRERAEAALEESRRSSARSDTTAQPSGPTEEQWQEMESKTGKTRDQIRADAQMAQAVADARVKPALDEVAAARKDLAETRKEIAAMKAGRGRESIESEFYDKNPALKSHKKDVDEVLSTYSDNDTVDSKTYQARLKLAQDVVRGRVKEYMRQPRPEAASRRLAAAGEVIEDTGDDEEFDPKGTGNEGAAHVMRKVKDSFGSDVRHDDSVEVWKKSLDEEGRGVAISSDEDVVKARKMYERGTAGGKRG